MEFIVKNWALVLVAFLSGGMLIWPMLRRGGGPWVNTLQATQLMNREDALVIDLRPVADFAKGHILGAKNVPLAELEQRAGELDRHKAKPVILHCADGSRSGVGATLLRKLGFGNVVNLAGGFAAWQQAGLPVEKK